MLWIKVSRTIGYGGHFLVNCQGFQYNCVHLYVLPDTKLHETLHFRKEFPPCLGKVGKGVTHWETPASRAACAGAVGGEQERPLTRWTDC